MVDPDGDGKNYFELQVSPANKAFDTRYDTRRMPKPFGHMDWNAGLVSGVVSAGQAQRRREGRGLHARDRDSLDGVRGRRAQARGAQGGRHLARQLLRDGRAREDHARRRLVAAARRRLPRAAPLRQDHVRRARYPRRRPAVAETRTRPKKPGGEKKPAGQGTRERPPPDTLSPPDAAQSSARAKEGRASSASCRAVNRAREKSRLSALTRSQAGLDRARAKPVSCVPARARTHAGGVRPTTRLRARHSPRGCSTTGAESLTRPRCARRSGSARGPSARRGASSRAPRRPRGVESRVFRLQRGPNRVGKRDVPRDFIGTTRDMSRTSLLLPGEQRGRNA